MYKCSSVQVFIKCESNNFFNKERETTVKKQKHPGNQAGVRLSSWATCQRLLFQSRILDTFSRYYRSLYSTA